MKRFEFVMKSLRAEAGELQSLATLLSDDERARASRFSLDRDRRRFVVARARLRQLLGERLGVNPKDVELVRGSHGKPALAARFASSGVRFNVSHCDDLALYAFAHDREIGVDVEAIRPIAGADDIATRFFSDAEKVAFAALPAGDKPLGFLNCWTRKEAFVKAIGNGLSHPLDSFDVSLSPHDRAEILRVDNTPGERCGWGLESFFPAPGFVAAVVTEL